MKKIALIMTMLLLAVQMEAQVRIRGTVVDSKGGAVPGAGVLVEGTAVGTVTLDDGSFTIEIPSGSKMLSVSSLGYKTLTIEARPVMKIVLEEDLAALDEVVVVGYGAMRRSDLTGSVASVSIDEDMAVHSSSVTDLLQGHAAGVQVSTSSASPDAGISVRIRGLSSFTSGSSEPLYVVDGIIINGNSSAETVQSNAGLDSSNADETNGLMGLNPQDIANIEVLKDASATAIYGSMGANGVILITTKTSNKEKPVIRYNAGVDVAMAYKKMPMLSFDEFVDYTVASGREQLLSRLYEDPQNRTGLLVQPMDWQDYMLRTAVSQRHYLSLSGRPKGMPYFFSLGYNHKEGIVKNTGVDQFTGRLNLEKSLPGNVKVGTKTSFAFISSSLVSGANASRATAAASMMRSMLAYRPYINQGADEESDVDYDEETYTSSPVKWLKDFSSTRKEFRLTPSLYVEWKILPWLTFKSTAGADFKSSEFNRWKGRSISRDNGTTGASLHYDLFNWNWDNMLMVNKKFGRHSISGTLGSATSSSLKVTNKIEGWQIWQDRGGLDTSLNSAVAPYTALDYIRYKTALQSFFVRGVYNYRDRYVLTATYRLDGSSKFQGRNKWASFPSFAAAWRLSEEPWFQAPVISMTKLRLGWGMVGNQAISAYKTLDTYDTTTIPDHNPGNDSRALVALYPNVLANRNLKWETTQQLNAGIDMGFWRGRLTFSIDAYLKDTKDLLQTINIAKSAGFTTMAVNSGSVRNMGLEFTLEAVPYRSRDLEWTIGGNISLNRGKITSIGEFMNNGTLYLTPDNPQTVNYFYGSYLRATTGSTGILNYFIEGQPMGLFYGFVYDGVAKSEGDGPRIGENGGQLQPGDARYLDINGNGYIDDDDRTVIGDPNPDFTFGLSTKFIWKGLSVSVMFNGAVGGDIYNLNNWSDFRAVYASESPVNIRREAFVNAWSPENPEGTFPRLGYDSTDRYSDRCVEDGSYLRLSNLSVSYNIPMKKNWIIKGLNVGVTGGNLLVVTNYSGWDPDVNSFGSDIRRIGVDMGSYPAARSISADIKFTF